MRFAIAGSVRIALATPRLASAGGDLAGFFRAVHSCGRNGLGKTRQPRWTAYFANTDVKVCVSDGSRPANETIKGQDVRMAGIGLGFSVAYTVRAPEAGGGRPGRGAGIVFWLTLRRQWYVVHSRQTPA